MGLSNIEQTAVSDRTHNASMIGWYLSKADQCLLLAHEATDPRERFKFDTEARRWRRLSADFQAAERSVIALLERPRNR
jgi:hypothetical protein